MTKYVQLVSITASRIRLKTIYSMKTNHALPDQKTEYPERVVFNKIGSEQKSLPKIRSFMKKIESTKCLSNQQSDKTISPNISTLATVTKLTNNHQ